MAEVYDYRNHKRPKEAWSNMERLHLMRKQGLLPALPEYGQEIGPYYFADTAPSEYCAPESDSA